MAAPLLLWALAALLAAPSLARSAAANASAAPTAVQEVRLGVLLPERNLRYPWAWPRVAPALRLALEALQPQLRHAGIALRTAFASTESWYGGGACYYMDALFQATGLRRSQDPDVLLGLGCYDASLFVGSFADLHQLPLLRAGRLHQRAGKVNTTVYAGPAAGLDLLVFEARVHQHFNWTYRSLVVVIPEVGYWEYWQYSLLAEKEFVAFTPYSSARVHKYEQQEEAVRFLQANGPGVQSMDLGTTLE
ncbi:UNVERIFIED_CONTAM: hypothetical protein K2H54_025561 [Gekko kuhli]